MNERRARRVCCSCGGLSRRKCGDVDDAVGDRRRARRRRGRCRAGRRPARLLLARSARPPPSRLAASSEAVGSSSSRTGWSVMKPRAMLTRCCSPPEKVAGGRLQSRSRQVEPASRSRGAVARRLAVGAAGDQRLGDDVERRDARHDAQELADIADGVAAHGQHRARVGAWRGRPARRGARRGSGPRRRRSCRRPSSGSSSCRRPTGRRARRIRRPRRENDTPATTGRRTPPRRCMVKALGDVRRRRGGVGHGVTPAGSRRRGAGCRARADRRAPGR